MMLGHFFLNDVSVSDTRICVDTRTTFVGYLSVKCSIQKNICGIFENFSTVLTQF